MKNEFSEKKLKLHLGCGSVYLTNYLNIDSPSNNRACLAYRRPDLVDQWQTTKDKYYEKQGPLNLSITTVNEFPVDSLLDITNMSFLPNSVDEILIVQTFEHFARSQVDQALKSWYMMLKPGGFVDIYVPNITKMIDLFITADTKEKRQNVSRLIFGTRKTELFYHHFGYNPQELTKLLAFYGFKNIQTNDSTMHDYPSFEIKGWK